MRSVMSHQFSQVPSANIQRSSFDRSHGFKTTFNAGYLVPIYLDEVLPGDSFNLNMTALARMATPIYPIMDNMFLTTFFFAVPVRLIWDNFQRFCGEQPNPGDSTDFTVPQMNSSDAAAGWYELHSLHDYFGLPTGLSGVGHSSLFHRAYNLVWNEWFRDQNLQDAVVVDKDDGPDDPDDYVLLRRGKRHDYFTSCLPWLQKGETVDIPLTAQAPLVNADIIPIGNMYPTFDTGSNNSNPLITINGQKYPEFNGTPDAQQVATWSSPGLGIDPTAYADLTDVNAITINQLREAFQVQRLLERDARSGTRYVEIIRSHFGVTSPDYRLQRPEYLGGGRSTVNISTVPQTSSTDATSPQGNLAATATAGVVGHGFVKSFVEHCVIIGLACVTADLTYQQGLPRMFSRLTRYDYYWPVLANLGEQAVLNKEIYFKGNAVDEEVFGYQERFAEYRYKQSTITGLFRSTHAGVPLNTSLDSWHLSQAFDDTPVLGPDFIVENPPIDRVIAVPSQPHFIFDSYIKLRCARPMPMYSVPGLIDHF